MLSTSVLSIKWTIKGKPKSLLASIGGDLIIRVNSQFTLNQISGQVIEHEEFWDLSASSAIAQAYFWASRRLFAATEAGKDFADSVKNWGSRLSTEKENLEIYPDPSGDPTKVTNHLPFFHYQSESFERRLGSFPVWRTVSEIKLKFLGKSMSYELLKWYIFSNSDAFQTLRKHFSPQKKPEKKTRFGSNLRASYDIIKVITRTLNNDIYCKTPKE